VLNVLALIDGDIYAGYGDYTNNTGPIHIESVPSSDPLAEWTDHLAENTEQILVFRLLGDGRVFVPQADPHGASIGGYAERALDGTWTDHSDAFTAQHVFGMAEVSGHLFACGAEGGNAVVWETTDGGATWTESLRSETSDLLVEEFERFYMLAVVGDAIYVQSSYGLESYKWTVATGWLPDSADLVIGPKAAGAPGVIWRDGYVYPNYTRIGPDPLSLYYFDGAARTLLTGDARGFSVADDGSLYVIESDHRLRTFAPTGPLTPTTVGSVEQLGSEINCSLVVLPGREQALVGTDQSRLKAVTLP
jgi:hypothetical protein